MLSSLLGTLFDRSPVKYVPSKGTGGSLNILAREDGVRSRELDAMGTVGTLFAIVDATSLAVASTDWKLWRKAKSGLKEDRIEVTRHAALDLLNSPNPFFTRQELFETGQQHADLTGETWLIVSRAGQSSLPLELWPVRPDRMAPVPDPDDYLKGYTYTDPDGEKIPLDLDEVLFIRKPHPSDPYRGIGAVQSILTDLDSSRYTSEWNRNFFKNSAEPGGVVEFDDRLTDDEWKEFQDRWRTSHQGVNNAHRVAVLERGRWVDRKYTMRDMQFAELRAVGSEVIREAFRFPKPMLGTVEDVNRANAEAAEVVFSRWLVVPRLERWKQMLNHDLLPLYGVGTNETLEFDYEDPVPPDQLAADTSLKTRIDGAVALIGTGKFTPASVLEALELPELEEAPEPEPEPQPAPAPPGAVPGEEEQAPEEDSAPGAPLQARRRAHAHHVHRAGHRLPPRNAANDIDPEKIPDLSGLQRDWQNALDDLLVDWRSIDAGWKKSLTDQVRNTLEQGDLLGLSAMGLDSLEGSTLLESAMLSLASDGADSVVDEARRQGVHIQAVLPRRDAISDLAEVTVRFLAAELAVSAGREASRLAGTGSHAVDVAEGVSAHLASLTDSRATQHLGGALTSAQNNGRIATFLAAPSAAYYASEQNDSNTCRFCRRVDGRWLGNSVAEAQLLYPNGGYVDCEGRTRCRGTVVAVWRPEQTGDEE